MANDCGSDVDADDNVEQTTTPATVSVDDVRKREITTKAFAKNADTVGVINEAFIAEDDDNGNDNDDENDQNVNIARDENQIVRRRLDFGTLNDRSPRFVRRNACRRVRHKNRRFESRAIKTTPCTVAPSNDTYMNESSRDYFSTNQRNPSTNSVFSDAAVSSSSLSRCLVCGSVDACGCECDRELSSTTTTIGFAHDSDLIISRLNSCDYYNLCSCCVAATATTTNFVDDFQVGLVSGNSRVRLESEEWDAIPVTDEIDCNSDRYQPAGREQSFQNDYDVDMTNIHIHASGGGGSGSGNPTSGSGAPPNLLPRRHVIGGPQPPPLPPARHRNGGGGANSVNVGGNVGNCCCCGGGIIQQPSATQQQQLQQPTPPPIPPSDRRAVSDQYPTSGDSRNGHRIGHRRDRRQQQSTTSNDVTSLSPSALPGSPLPPPVPPHGPELPSQSTTGHSPQGLPDILNSHLPPPYSTLPHTTEHSSRRGLNVAVPQHPPPPAPRSPPLLSSSSSLPPTPVTPTVVVTTTTNVAGCPSPPAITSLPLPISPPRRSTRAVERFSSITRPSTSRRHRSNRPPRSTPRGTHYTPEDEPKNCCGVAVTQTVSIRWFIVMIAFVGLCCAVVGTVLGALKATGREHLTVSLLMIGVGIVLITVSGIAWRLTSHDAPSCRMMLGLHSEEPEPNRRFVPRVPPSYGRPHHPYAAMMYPEFQYRPPPPSYQASMQEYRLRLLLLDRHQPAPSASHSPVSPPPTYRSGANSDTYARPPITFAREATTAADYSSRPPSYRSRASSVNPNPGSGTALTSSDTTTSHPSGSYAVGTIERIIPTTTVGTTATVHHSRDPSVSLSLLSHESLFDVAANARLTPPEVMNTSRCYPIVTNVSTNSTGALRLEQGMTVTPKTAGVTTMTTNRFSVHSDSDGVNHNVVGRRPHDCNVVTIVQTTNSSRVLAHDGQEHGLPLPSSGVAGIQIQRTPPTPQTPSGELEVLAHL